MRLGSAQLWDLSKVIGYPLCEHTLPGSCHRQWLHADGPAIHAACRCRFGFPAELQFKQELAVRDPAVLNLYTGSFLAQTGGNVLLGWSSYPWDVAALPAQDGVSLFFESLPGECILGLSAIPSRGA